MGQPKHHFPVKYALIEMAELLDLTWCRVLRKHSRRGCGSVHAGRRSCTGRPSCRSCLQRSPPDRTPSDTHRRCLGDYHTPRGHSCSLQTHTHTHTPLQADARTGGTVWRTPGRCPGGPCRSTPADKDLLPGRLRQAHGVYSLSQHATHGSRSEGPQQGIPDGTLPEPTGSATHPSG